MRVGVGIVACRAWFGCRELIDLLIVCDEEGCSLVPLSHTHTLSLFSLDTPRVLLQGVNGESGILSLVSRGFAHF